MNNSVTVILSEAARTPKNVILSGAARRAAKSKELILACTMLVVATPLTAQVTTAPALGPAPKLSVPVVQAATLAGDYAVALAYQDLLMPLHVALFLEPGLVGAKYAMSQLGLCTPEVRLPLLEATEGTKAAIDAAMRHAGLLD